MKIPSKLLALTLLVSSGLMLEAQTLTDYQNAVNAITPAPQSNYHFANGVTNSGTQGGSLSTSGSTAFVTDSYGNATQAIQFVNSGSSSAYRGTLDLGSTGTLLFMFQTPGTEAGSDQYVLRDMASDSTKTLRLFLADDSSTNNTSNLRLQVANLTTSTITTVGENQWYFFAMTWDVSSGSLSYYVGPTGGSLTTASPSISNTSSVGDPAATFFLGNYSNTASSGLAGGAIDEFTVFDSALTSTQINGIYATTVPEPTGVALVGLGLTLALFKARASRRRASL